MLKYPEFMQQQNMIYEKLWFGHRDAIREGLTQDPAYQNHVSGIGIVLRPEASILNEVECWAGAVKKAVPSALVYRTLDLHTTVTVMDIPEGVEEKNRLMDICHDAVEAVLREHTSVNKGRFMSKFIRAIFNRTSMLTTAYPTSELVEMISSILDQIRVRGVLPKAPWGMHMMLAHFTEVTSAASLENSGLVDIVEKCPLAQRRNVFSAVDVVSYELNRRGMNFVVHHRFPLG